MDKRAILGIFLILVVTILFSIYQQNQLEMEPPAGATADSGRVDLPDTVTTPVDPRMDSPVLPDRAAIVAPDSTEPEPPGTATPSDKAVRIHLESDLVNATLSTAEGGKLVRWELNRYAHYLGGPVDLAAGYNTLGIPTNGLNIEIIDKAGNRLSLKDFTLFSSIEEDRTIRLDENNPSEAVELYLPVQGGRIVKRYEFHYNRYMVDVSVRFVAMNQFVGNRYYALEWENGLWPTEENRKEDFDYARAYAYMGEELVTLDVSDEESVREEKTGTVDWTAIRTKYFLAAIIPGNPENLSVTLFGQGIQDDDLLNKVYATRLSVEIPLGEVSEHSDSYQLYLGPLDYRVLEDYDVGLESLVMNKDWYEGLFRWISLLILPAFKALHTFIPNYGLVIIVFSILVKLLLHPLTKKSYQSMSQMQVIQPEMTEMREKYKNDPQRLNKEMMKLYQERGINPLGGCLPTLLQMPLLFALFIVFRSTIQLRGEPFILWINDLSRPDTLALGFSLPFIGDAIHVLPFLMGLTMIWQSKLTVTDPKQKFMVYLMPVFITFIFYSLPSGLNLYYAVFNLLSMVQTRAIKKKMETGQSSDGKATPAKAAPAKKEPRSAKRKSGRK